MKYSILWIKSFILVMLLAWIPCGNVDAAKVKVKSVKVQAPYQKTIEVAKKKSVKIVPVVNVTPNKKANKKVTFSSKNKKIATVNSKGVVKGKKAGKTKIVVTSKKNKKKKTTISVVVKKNPIQKVSLNKTSMELQPNQAALLKATITAKSGSSKKVYWTSSNESVATVSQNGSVAAKGTGTAVITVQAIDGSKKKAQCVVTVKKVTPVAPAPQVTTVNLATVAINNSRMMTFTLDQPLALQASQITLMTKEKKTDSYVTKVTPTSVKTTDNKTYTIEMLGESALIPGGYVQISIPSLTGTKKQMELQCGQDWCPVVYRNSTVRMTAGVDNGWHYIGLYGTESAKVEGLLDGMTATMVDGELKIRKTPTKAGASIATITIEDDMCSKRIIEIPFIAESDTQLVACAPDMYVSRYGSDYVEVEGKVHVGGGSGTYEYSIIGENHGLSIEDGWIEGYLYAAGDYQLVVEVKDKSNPNLSCRVNVNIHVTQMVTCAIKVKDASGLPVTDAVQALAYCQDGYTRFSNTVSNYVDSDDGIIYLTLPVGKWDIRIVSEYQDETYKIYDDVVLSSNTILDAAKVPLYQVRLNGNKGQASFSYATWYDNNNNVLGNNHVLYLKKGTYQIHASASSSSLDKSIIMNLRELSAQFTVTDKPIDVNVTMTDVSNQFTIDNVAVGTMQVTLDQGERKIYRFVPTESGNYTFSMKPNANVYFTRTDDVFSYNTTHYVYSTSQNNIKYYYEAGKTYYIMFKYMYSTSSGEFDVEITKTN